MSRAGWIQIDTELYQKTHEWIQRQYGADARKIGLSNSGNLKYTDQQNAVHAIQPDHLPNDLRSLWTTQRFLKNASAEKSLVKAGVEDFAQELQHAKELDQYWGELCTLAQIDGVPRRQKLGKTTVTLGSCRVSLPAVHPASSDWREDGQYTDFWKKIYQYDVRQICGSWNRQALTDTLDALCRETAKIIRPTLSEKLIKQFGEDCTACRIADLTPENMVMGRFSMHCELPAGSFGTGTAEAHILLGSFAQLLIDGLPSDSETAINAAEDDTRRHRYSVRMGQNGKVQIRLPQTIREMSLGNAYQVCLNDVLSDCIKRTAGHALASYLYKVPAAAASLRSVLNQADLSYDNRTQELTVSCAFGTLRAEKETHRFQFVEMQAFLTAVQDERLFRSRQKICEEIQQAYEKKCVYRASTMRPSSGRGYGILAGDTVVTFLCGEEHVSIPFVMPESGDGKAYEQAVRTLYETAFCALSQQLHRKEDARRAAKWELYDLALADPLDIAILEYTEVNGAYVTANAIQQALRGTKIQLDACLQQTEGCGRFKMISGDAVVSEIRKLERNGFLVFHTIYGTYGAYDLVRIKEQGLDVLDIWETRNRTPQSRADWWTLPQTFGDFLQSLQCRIANREDARREQLDLMHHLDAPHMIAWFHDEIVDAFPREDADMVKVLKLYRSMQPKGSFLWEMLGHILRGRHLAGSSKAQEEGTAKSTISGSP